MEKNNIVMVRGGGDLASGVIHRLYRCGYRVVILETERPSAIRRMVSFCEAVYDGEAFVEGVLSRRIEEVSQCQDVWDAEEIPLLIDEGGSGGSPFSRSPGRRDPGETKSGHQPGYGTGHHWPWAGI